MFAFWKIPKGSNHLVRGWLGCPITFSAKYLGSITTLRRRLDPWGTDWGYVSSQEGIHHYLQKWTVDFYDKLTGKSDSASLANLSTFGDGEYFSRKQVKFKPFVSGSEMSE